MKFYRITEILKFRENKANIWANNRKIYNRLYKGSNIRNSKKKSIKMNHFYSQSELYPYSPIINHSGYITFSPNNGGIPSINTNRYDLYKKNYPINKKYSTLSDYYSLGRNMMTDNNLYNNKIPNILTDNNDNNNDNIINGYPNDYLNNIRVKKPGNFNKKFLIRTDNDFFSPYYTNRNRNIYSNRDDKINNQISEYLNNFNDNKRKLDLYNKNNNQINSSNDYPIKKRNKSNINLSKKSKYDLSGKRFQLNKINESPYKTNYQDSKVDNYFNKRSNKNINNISRTNNNSLNFKKSQDKKNNNIKYNLKYNSRKKIGQDDDKNNKKIYNDSKDYYYSFNKENNDNNNINKNVNSKKNSNVSLNPSSLGVDHMKTFYTNKPIGTNNNLNIGNGVASNINSASSRMLDTNYHFLNGLKMATGEINEYFFDFNSNKRSKDKSDDQKTVQSLQSLSDSKIMELANYYITDESDSVENYRMNNVVFNKKKHHIK